MRHPRTLLFVFLALLAFIGAGLIMLANLGDASVLASTSNVHGALERAGAQDNAPLRNDLYTIVLRLKDPWALVHLSGFVVLLISLAGLATVGRRLK